MRKLKYFLPLLVLGTVFTFGVNDAEAAPNPSTDLEIPLVSGKMVYPQNTSCRAIDFNTDIKRTNYDSATWSRYTFNGVDQAGNTIDDIYDLCVGSFPRYPSTSVEGGITPYYYMKYRLIPDPMPVYEVTTTPVVVNGTEIVGVNQTFDMDESYEGKDKPSDENIFIFYPYDKEHVNKQPYPKSTIRGPYQIGYNSFFHNTYRARYFASQVKFEFTVLEPKKGTNYTSLEGEVYQDKKVLFSGEIIYDVPDTCFRDDYLDYKESCRDIEFYFPKGNLNATDKTFDGEVEDSVGQDSKSTNVIPKQRLPYMNPGEHNLLINVTENTQLRVQKDYGTEYQTVGNENNVGSISGIDSWKNYVVYFGRDDKYIEGPQAGSTIAPLSEITQYPTHNGKKISNNTIRNSGKMATDIVAGGEYTYDPAKNENWLNYCDYNTSQWGAKDTSERTENSGGTTPRSGQSDTACYHNDGRDTHFFQYDWSNTTWYAQDPERWLP